MRTRPALMGMVVLTLTATVAATACAADDPQASRSSTAGSSTVASSTTTEPNVYEKQRAAGVQRLLDQLGTALTHGDRTRLAAVLDESASPAFRNRMTTVAANFGAERGPRGQAVRLRTFHYELAPTEEAEQLVPARLQSRLDAQGSSDTWVAPVDLGYGLGGATLPGIDEPEVVVGTQLVVARYGDTWKVVGDPEAIGAAAPQATLWDLPGLAVRDVPTSGGTSVVASYPGTDQTVARLARLLPGAVAAVESFWGADWPRRAVVVPTAAPAEFAALTGGGGGQVSAAAATVFARIDRATSEVSGQRVILTPNARGLPEPALAVVLRHELTHVAARRATGMGAPLWLTEGVPEYVGRKGTYRRFADAAPDLATSIREGGPPRELPADADFGSAGTGAQAAYQSAWSVAAFVADRFDEARLKALYRGVAVSSDRARQDAAIASTLGVSRARFVSDWQRWLTEQVR